VISTIIDESLEAIVEVQLLDAAGASHFVEPLIDTGYNGYLSLPTRTVLDLGFPHLLRFRAELADGSQQVVHSYEGRVSWLEVERTIEIDALDAQPLLGMALLNNCLVGMEVWTGGRVTIAPRAS
jgi:clan AA aspartic protease